MNRILFYLKNNISFSLYKKGITYIVLSFVFISPLIVYATMYSPGATLEPDCAPGSANCGVLAGLSSSNNLSDLNSVSTARTNLGLGTLAIQSGTFSGTSSGTNTGDQTTITGNAGTATALAANGANCSAGLAPLGVDASGAVESCTDFEEDLSNSAGLLAALSDETGTGLAVFGTSPTLITPILGVATATSINKLTITAPTTSAILTIDDGFTLHTTGNVTALSGSHSGTSSGTNTGDQTTITGNAGTATALAANGANCSAGLAPLGVDASGAVESCTDFEEDLSNSAGLLAALSDETGTGLAVFGTSPTFTTSLTVPLVLGGTSTTQDLSFQTTSGVGATGGDMHFLVGNNGATEAMTVLNSGLVGIGTIAPTHALTFPTASTGIVLYNTADQTTNYERLLVTAGGVSSNIFDIRSQNGGSGTLRSLRLGSQGTLTMPGTASSSGSFQFSASTSGAGTAVVQVGGTYTGSSGNTNILLINPTINQSSTAGYNGLMINPTETTTGSGNKNLILAQVGGVSKFTVSNTGAVTLADQMLTSSSGIEFTESDTNPTCASGNFNVYADLSENKLKKCQNGVASDLNAIPDANSFTDTTTESIADDDTTDYWDGTVPNITPKSTNSEILVMMTATITGTSATETQISAQIMRHTSAITCQSVGTAVGGQTGAMQGFTTGGLSISKVFVDNPGTTSNVQYTLCSEADTEAAAGTMSRIDFTLFEINNAADLAEIYSTNNIDISVGDVVSLDSSLKSGVRKSTGVNDKSVIGIVSTKPAMVIGATANEGVSVVPVALSGRVPVKVTTENGAIKSGDYLAPSSISGVAMKSNGIGPVIGLAMSSYDGEEIGLVTVFVKNFDLGNINELSVSLGDIANIDENNSGFSSLVAEIQSENVPDPVALINKKISEGKKFLVDLVSARVTAIRGYFDEVFTRKIYTEELCLKDSGEGQVCITADQIRSVMNTSNAGVNTNINTNTDTVVDTNSVTPDKEIVKEITDETVEETTIPTEEPVHQEEIPHAPDPVVSESESTENI